MKLKKLLLILTPILVLVLTTPANSDYEPYRHYSNDGSGEDHPWGGDDPSGGGDVGKSFRFDLAGTPLVYIDVIQFLFAPNFDYVGDPNRKNETDNLLPATYTGPFDYYRGNWGRGR